MARIKFSRFPFGFYAFMRARRTMTDAYVEVSGLALVYRTRELKKLTSSVKRDLRELEKIGERMGAIVKVKK